VLEKIKGWKKKQVERVQREERESQKTRKELWGKKGREFRVGIGVTAERSTSE
jgi:hypothetical protein